MFAVSYQGNLKALDINGGGPVWTRKASSYHSVTAGDNNLYLAESNGYITAVDQSTGAASWTQKALAYRALSAPAVSGEYVIAGDFAGYVYVLSASDGSFVASYDTGSGGIRAQPVVAGDVVYVYTNNGNLIALQLRHK